MQFEVTCSGEDEAKCEDEAYLPCCQLERVELIVSLRAALVVLQPRPYFP